MKERRSTRRKVIPLLLPLLVGMAGQATADEPSPSTQSIRDLKLHWANRIQVSGAVEVDANHQNNGVGSDVAVSTVELAMDARINDWTNAHVLLLHEEGSGSTIEVDEATITIGNPEQSLLYMTAGKMVVPFGDFSTQLLSDPLTLELAETSETALQVGFKNGPWSGSVYLFNGASKKTDKDQLDQWGANIGYKIETNGVDMAFGIGYINAMENSGSLSELLTAGKVQDYVAGWSTHAAFAMGPYSLTGEYISALESFDQTALAWENQEARPQAWSAELGYAFNLMGREASAIIGYQGTKEAAHADLKLPESRLLGGTSITLEENTTLGFEFHHDEGYSTAKEPDGTDNNSATVRLAISF